MKKRNKLSYWILSITIITATIISCNKKYEGDENSIEVIRNANNNGTYSKTKLDSLQAINLITTQKVQDLLDLSALYTSGNKDTEIDSVIYTQMQAHFLSRDSNNLKPLLKEMDSLRVRYAKVSKLATSGLWFIQLKKKPKTLLDKVEGKKCSISTVNVLYSLNK